MTTEIQPCPFCGGMCRTHGGTDEDEVHWFRVECYVCGYQTRTLTGDSEPEAALAAIAAHDRIASLATLGAEVVAAERRAQHLGTLGTVVAKACEAHRARTGANRTGG